MSPRRAVVGLLAVLATATLAGYAAPLEQPVPMPAAQAPKVLWLGSGSCAAMGCHNANGLSGEQRSEYTTWVSHDRHARAYEVLYSVKSRTISANLKRPKAAANDSLCLNCHVHAAYDKTDHHPHFAKEDGVGCESCHGPASTWVANHYRNRPTPEQKRQMGMADTWSLPGRVRSCLPCHVGTQDMDVNHDLIAAGHPRLAFDFSAYHALMPHHWQDVKDKKSGASPWARDDWDAAAWFVGEALTTQAAMRLLECRSASRVWPEFAEYDCYACHHRLQKLSWRQERDFKQREAGSLAWNDWYFSGLPLRTFADNAKAGSAVKSIDELRKLMEKTVVPKAAAGKRARAVADLLDDWARFLCDRNFSEMDRTDARRHLTAGAVEQAIKNTGSWDEAAKNYLALVALSQAPGDMSPKVKEALSRIRDYLRAPEGVHAGSTHSPSQLLQPYKLLQESWSAR
jgi:hypothetical protein